MAVGLDNALQIAKSSLFTNQYRLNVISENVANADNVNYTRKEVNVETSHSISITPGTIGTGVNVREVVRLIDKFLEKSISENQSDLGRYDIANKYLTNVEQIFNDLKGKGVSSKLEAFWNSWFDLSNNPSGMAERISVLDKSKGLTDVLNYTYTSLENQQKNVNLEISNIVDKINDISSKIAKLNNSIYSIEIDERNHANDLRDQRDALVKELSKYLDIRYLEENHKYVIFTANGKTLVNGSFSFSLKAQANPNNNNFYDVYWLDSKGNPENITSMIRGGELKGLIDVRDKYIEKYKNEIGKISNAIFTEVNKLHSQGSGINLFNDVISDVSVQNKDLSFNFEGLQNSVKSGNLKIAVYDNNGNFVDYKDIAIGDVELDNSNSYSPSTDNYVNTLEELKDSINTINHLHAEIVNNRLHIYSDSGYKFGFVQDTSDVLSGLGINTFFSGKKYEITKDVNLVATQDSNNADQLYYVGTYNKNLLTGHEYKVSYDSTNDKLTITDLFTGETLSKDEIDVEKIDGKLAVRFDGIDLRINNSDWTGDDTYYIKNLNSMSIYDDSLVDNHTYQINFSQGDSSISITDLTENRTLTDKDYEIHNVDVNGDNVPDYKTIIIKKTGMTITIDNNSFGVIEIKPETAGAKYIKTKLDEEHADFVNAGKINGIEVNYSKDVTPVYNTQIVDYDLLTRKKYTIVALGNGNYDITDEDGNKITPTLEGANFVEFDGIRINFASNTNNGDLYTVQSNLLDYSTGDNRIASEIANLKNKKVLNNNTESISDKYSNLIGAIGLNKNDVQNKLEAAKINNEGLMKQRDSISGVSIDEEMTKLIQTQNAYIASAKLITVVDRLTQTLLNSVS